MIFRPNSIFTAAEVPAKVLSVLKDLHIQVISDNMAEISVADPTPPVTIQLNALKSDSNLITMGLTVNIRDEQLQRYALPITVEFIVGSAETLCYVDASATTSNTEDTVHIDCYISGLLAVPENSFDLPDIAIEIAPYIITAKKVSSGVSKSMVINFRSPMYVDILDDIISIGLSSTQEDATDSNISGIKYINGISPGNLGNINIVSTTPGVSVIVTQPAKSDTNSDTN